MKFLSKMLLAIAFVSVGLIKCSQSQAMVKPISKLEAFTPVGLIDETMVKQIEATKNMFKALNNSDNAFKEQLKIALDQGVDINVKNPKGNTVLRKAVLLNKKEMVTYLIENKSNVNLEYADGFTSLDCAVFKRDREMVQLLIKLGARVTQEDINRAILNFLHIMHKHTISAQAKVINFEVYQWEKDLGILQLLMKANSKIPSKL